MKNRRENRRDNKERNRERVSNPATLEPSVASYDPQGSYGGHPLGLRSFALDHSKMHASAVPVYADGSKSDAGLGCSAVFPSFEALYSLLLELSTYI